MLSEIDETGMGTEAFALLQSRADNMLMFGLEAFRELPVQPLSVISDLSREQAVSLLIHSIFYGDYEFCEQILLRPGGFSPDYDGIASIYRAHINLPGLFSVKNVISTHFVDRFNRVIDVIRAAGFPDNGDYMLSLFLGTKMVKGAVAVARNARATHRVASAFAEKSQLLPDYTFKLPVLDSLMVTNPELLIVLGEAAARPFNKAYRGILCWARAEMVLAHPDHLRAYTPNLGIYTKTVNMTVDGRFEVLTDRVDVGAYKFADSIDNVSGSIQLGLKPFSGQKVNREDAYALQHYANQLLISGLAPEFQSGLLLCCTTVEFLNNYDRGPICPVELSAIRGGFESFVPLGLMSSYAAKFLGNSQALPECGVDSMKSTFSIYSEVFNPDRGLMDAFMGLAGEGLCQALVRTRLDSWLTASIIIFACRSGLDMSVFSGRSLVLNEGNIHDLKGSNVSIPAGIVLKYERLYYDRDEVAADHKWLVEHTEKGTAVNDISLDASVSDLLAESVNVSGTLMGGKSQVMLRYQLESCDIEELVAAASYPAHWDVIASVRGVGFLADNLSRVPEYMHKKIALESFNI